ncbi:MAG: hypothetical protein K2K77_09445, partial [Duncaniella sp.]|nr:hypothetical protein [Duncaniella sp.]
MNESLTRLFQSLDDPAAGATLSDVMALGREYPFFVLPAVLALKHHGAELSHDERESLLRRIALNSPDPQAMFMLADVAYEDWVQFYPSQRKEVSTGDAITKFLETYGHTDAHEEALLERLIFNPTPDYSSMLAREEEYSLPSMPDDPADNSQDALINAFILRHKDDESSLLPREEPEPEPAASVTPQPAVEADIPHNTPSQAPDTAYDSSLSESLAKIY